MCFVLYRDQKKRWRWRLVSANNEIIADSPEAYRSKADAEHGISLIKSSYRAVVYET
ncbi:MAG: DUF1508 domain-containing protein [Pseudomonadota bacterium]